MEADAIRPFRQADRAELVALWDHCELTRPWNDPDADIDRKLAMDDDLLLVAVRGDRMVGSVMAGYEGHRGWINYLAVDPDHRRLGIAKELMQEAENRLRSGGCPKINLQIRDVDTGAAAFYAALGYAEDRVISMGKRLVDDEN